MSDVKSWVDATFVGELGLDAAETITGRIVVQKVEHAYSAFDVDELDKIGLTATAQVEVTGKFQWAVTV